MSMREATRVARALETDLRSELPEVSRIDIHLEPLELEIVHGRDVTKRYQDLVEQLCSIATADPRVTACDDVERSSRAGEITAHLTITVADDLTLEQAHEIETRLEGKVRQAAPLVKRAVVRAHG